MEVDIEEEYNCLVCREEWTTERYHDLDEVFTASSICLHCDGSIFDAIKDRLNYQKETYLQVGYYVLKRVVNNLLLAIRLP